MKLDYKQLIKEMGIKQTFIADKLGISNSLLSLFLDGKRNLKPEKADILHKILNR